MAEPSEQVFVIGCGTPGAHAASPDALGFKAYNLWRMERLGMPVPQAFVLGTGLCQAFFRHGREAPPDLRELLLARVRDIERGSGLVFGSARKPLLLSVRSGAAVSMPGMLETVLDIGVCDATVPGLLRLTGNPRLVWDSYRRFVQSFAEVVHRIPPGRFDTALATQLHAAGVETPRELDFQSLRALTRDYLRLFEESAGQPFPQQPLDQLEAAVIAVWRSWVGEKAAQYRRLNNLSDDLGTAVTVQRMVFGNAGGSSGAGVAFTRNPASGEPSLYFDFMFNAQGEDVVSGRCSAADGERLAGALPSVYQDILKVARALESEFRDMQEFEFTVQNSKLYMLQARPGKRTPWAALRIGVDMVEEGLIDVPTALARLKGLDLQRIERSRVVAADAVPALSRAVGAGVGVAIGEIALDSERAAEIARSGRAVILVRPTISTGDIGGIAVSAGVLTATGGRTSHAAVVARQLNKVCVVGCEGLTVDLTHRRCALAGRWLSEGDTLSLDGESGDIFAGAVRVVIDKPTDYLARVARWLAGRVAA